MNVEPKKRGRKKSDPVTVTHHCAICNKGFARTYPCQSHARHFAPKTCSRDCAAVQALVTRFGSRIVFEVKNAS